MKSPTRTCAVLTALGALTVGGCVTQPPYLRSSTLEAPGPLPAPPSTQVLFYPAAGQSPEQQDRDRYECYRWAVQQTGFDPAQPQVAPHQRVAVVPGTPPGANTTAGAFTGALLGAAVSNPRNAGGGTLVGAIAGAMLGAAADAGAQQQTQQLQQRYDQLNARDAAQGEQQAGTFRSATSACLGGRGYTVQ